MQTIFVVDCEENTRNTISEYLMREKFRVETFASVKEVLERMQSGFPDMFVLDIVLPVKECFKFYQGIRNRSGVPVILLADQGEKIDRIWGIESGEYNFLTKPCSPRELISLVRSLFRCSAVPIIMEELVEIGNLKIDLNDRHATVDEKEVMLTPMEYEFLLLLAGQPQRTFKRQELLDRVWGCDYVGSARAVDDLVKRLRRKLRVSGAMKNVKTIWGYGYRFEE